MMTERQCHKTCLGGKKKRGAKLPPRAEVNKCSYNRYDSFSGLEVEHACTSSENKHGRLAKGGEGWKKKIRKKNPPKKKSAFNNFNIQFPVQNCRMTLEKCDTNWLLFRSWRCGTAINAFSLSRPFQFVILFGSGAHAIMESPRSRINTVSSSMNSVPPS